MTIIQNNQEIIRKLYEEALNKRNWDVLPELIAEDYTGQNSGKGVAAFAEPLLALVKAFANIQWEIREMIGEGNKIMVKQQWQGTHTGPFQQIAATGKRITNEGVVIYELKESRIVQTHLLTDRLGFFQQLGVLPLDISLLPGKKAVTEPVHFIDKFLVPAPAKAAFYERMRMNREFIKNLPGFIGDAAYEYTDEEANLICVTVAKWESAEALEDAKQAVQAEYKKQGFNPAQLFQQLGITLDRAVYREIEAD